MTGRKLFGTDGIRGKANVYPMTGEVAMALGRAVTAYFQKKARNKKPLIIIGKDTRLSCYMLEQAFASGVCSQGGRAILTGPLPTPGVAFVTQSMRADAGVMISASHNPYSDNGIKLFDRNGEKLPDAVELELEKMILQPELIVKKLDESLGSAKRLDEVIGRYVVKVKAAFNENYSLENMRLIVDGANGAGYKIAPMAFEELGAEVVPMGNTPNGININHNVGALHPEACAEAVLKYRSDLGICLDGDGDRLVVVDNKGRIADGDQLMGVIGHFLQKTNQLGSANEVVGTVMSNFGLEKFFKEKNINFYRTNVGDRYVLERMKHSGALFGGEPSGHLVFKAFSTTGDGILAALKVIECIKYFDRDLSELLDQVELVPQKLTNVMVKKRIPFEEIPELQKMIADLENQLKNEGRLLLRYSGTENLVRIMVEAQDDAVVNSISKTLEAAIVEYLK